MEKEKMDNGGIKGGWPCIKARLCILRKQWKGILWAFAKDLKETPPTPRDANRPIELKSYSRFELTVRFCSVVLILCMVTGAMLCKMWQIQIRDHQSNLDAANKLLGLSQRLIGTRGEIFDYDNILLAGNLRTKDLYLTPRHIIERKVLPDPLASFSEFLAPRIGMKPEEIVEKCNKLLHKRVPVTLATNVSRDTVNRITSLNLKGVEIQLHDKDESIKDVKMALVRKDILFYPQDIEDPKERDRVIYALIALLSLDEQDTFQACKRVLDAKSPLKLATCLTIEEAAALQEAFNEWNKTRNKRGKVISKIIPQSFYFEDSTKRVYPRDRTLSNLLGFCDTDNEGITGIEGMMNAQMRGSTQYRHIVLDGTVGLFRYPKSIYEPTLNGDNVFLTIQLPLQQMVETHLARLVEEHKPKRAYVIMMDPHSGAIMALAQYPSYSYVDKQQGDNRSFHALVDGFEPGSIMKAVSVSSAIDAANLSTQHVIFCENGSWSYGGGKPMREHGNIRFGDMTLVQIIQKSSNIGSGKAVIENLSEMDFYNYLRAYGMGSPTGLGFYPLEGDPIVFTEEGNGILHPVQRWRPCDIPRIAIGHAIVVTPFQMVQAYGAIANGGRMMQPYIVDRIVKATGETVPSIPRQKGTPVSSDTARKIMECMCATVEKGGTATSAQVPGYRVCGKTGTAEKFVIGPNGKGSYSHTKHTTSFLGIAPVDNPAIVLMVTADEPSGPKRYGGSVCGKTFSNIAGDTLRMMQIPPTVPDEPANHNTMLR